MRIRSEQRKDDRQKSIAESHTHNPAAGAQNHRLTDNRSQAVTQRKLQALANSSPLVNRSGLAKLTAMLSAQDSAQQAMRTRGNRPGEARDPATENTQSIQERSRSNTQQCNTGIQTTDPGRAALQRFCIACELEKEDHKRAPAQLASNASIQREPNQKPTITGRTHLVKMINGSILGGKEGPELEHGKTIEIDPASGIRSRRGPNQEEFAAQDRERNTPIYTWYRVVEAGYEGCYVRQDALADLAAEEESASEENDQVAEYDRIIEANKKTPPYKFLKLESIGHVVAGILKIIAGIALGAFGAIHALIGQLVGGVCALAIGVMKWFRAKAMEKLGKQMQSLVVLYTRMRNYVVSGKRDASGLEPNKGEREADRLDDQMGQTSQKIDMLRVGESVVGLIGSVANCISGAIAACFGIVPNIVKATRATAQLKGWKNTEKIGMIIKCEAVLSALIAIFSIEEGIRKLGGGESFGGKFGVSYHEDPKDVEGIKDWSAGVSGVGGAASGLGVAGAKGIRGQVTPAAGAAMSARKRKKEALKEQKRIAKRIRAEASGVRAEMDD